MNLNIKTRWQGQVGIRECFILAARRNAEGITVSMPDGRMYIPKDELDSLCVGKSDKPVKDKFGVRSPEYLYYYKWAPQAIQEVMV